MIRETNGRKEKIVEVEEGTIIKNRARVLKEIDLMLRETNGRRK